jgi:hypothetical protein
MGDVVIEQSNSAGVAAGVMLAGGVLCLYLWYCTAIAVSSL